MKSETEPVHGAAAWDVTVNIIGVVGLLNSEALGV